MFSIKVGKERLFFLLLTVSHCYGGGWVLMVLLDRENIFFLKKLAFGLS